MSFSMRLVFTDILRPDSLRNFPSDRQALGYQFQVRLAYYRGHYLSCIDQFQLEVDGQTVADKALLFCLNGKEFEPVELRRQSAEFWEILKPATIKVHHPGGLEPGEHNVKLTLMLRSPYMPQPGASEPHRYVPIDSSDEQALVLIKGGAQP